MKIMILSVNYWPEVTGIGAVTTYRAEHLAAAGHEVEVCTTFPYYPDWEVPQEYSGKLGLKEKRNGVRIVRSYAYIPNPVKSLNRILFEASFIIGVTIRVLLRKRPDVLLVVSPPLGLAATAILLSRLWSIPYVFDVEDLQPDSASDLGMLPKWAVRLLYKVENAAYRHARLVTTLTPSMRQKIVNKGLAEDKVELLEPRMDDSFIDLLPEEGKKFRRRYDLGEKFLVTHSGNMGVKQGLDVILDAAGTEPRQQLHAVPVRGQWLGLRKNQAPRCGDGFGQCTVFATARWEGIPRLDGCQRYLFGDAAGVGFRGRFSVEDRDLSRGGASYDCIGQSRVRSCPHHAGVGSGQSGRSGESASPSGRGLRIEKRRFAQGGRECARIRMHALVVRARFGATGAQPHDGGGASNERPGLEGV